MVKIAGSPATPPNAFTYAELLQLLYTVRVSPILTLMDWDRRRLPLPSQKKIFRAWAA